MQNLSYISSSGEFQHWGNHMLGGVESHYHTFFNNLEYCTGQESIRARTVEPETLRRPLGRLHIRKYAERLTGNLELKDPSFHLVDGIERDVPWEP